MITFKKKIPVINSWTEPIIASWEGLKNIKKSHKINLKSKHLRKIQTVLPNLSMSNQPCRGLATPLAGNRKSNIICLPSTKWLKIHRNDKISDIQLLLGLILSLSCSDLQVPFLKQVLLKDSPFLRKKNSCQHSKISCLKYLLSSGKANLPQEWNNSSKWEYQFCKGKWKWSISNFHLFGTKANAVLSPIKWKFKLLSRNNSVN